MQHEKRTRGTLRFLLFVKQITTDLCKHGLVLHSVCTHRKAAVGKIESALKLVWNRLVHEQQKRPSHATPMRKTEEFSLITSRDSIVMKKAEDDPEDDVEESIFDGQKEIESAELREIFFFFFFFFLNFSFLT